MEMLYCNDGTLDILSSFPSAKLVGWQRDDE